MLFWLQHCNYLVTLYHTIQQMLSLHSWEKFRVKYRAREWGWSRVFPQLLQSTLQEFLADDKRHGPTTHPWMIDLAVLVLFSLSDWMPFLSPMVSTRFGPTRASTLHPGRMKMAYLFLKCKRLWEKEFGENPFICKWILRAFIRSKLKFGDWT